jgi:two-component system, cell cycle response regulator DivK
MAEAKTVLHIEDNFDNRLLVRRLLQAGGYRVIEASDAHQAHDALISNVPDLILMDINMPDIDGYTLTSQIKANPALQKVPIVTITANVMRGDREKVFQAGCNGYIEKPIDVDKFLDQVALFLA